MKLLSIVSFILLLLLSYFGLLLLLQGNQDFFVTGLFTVLFLGLAIYLYGLLKKTKLQADIYNKIRLSENLKIPSLWVYIMFFVPFTYYTYTLSGVMEYFSGSAQKVLNQIIVENENKLNKANENFNNIINIKRIQNLGLLKDKAVSEYDPDSTTLQYFINNYDSLLAKYTSSKLTKGRISEDSLGFSGILFPEYSKIQLINFKISLLKKKQSEFVKLDGIIRHNEHVKNAQGQKKEWTLLKESKDENFNLTNYLLCDGSESCKDDLELIDISTLGYIAQLKIKPGITSVIFAAIISTSLLLLCYLPIITLHGRKRRRI